MVRDILDNPDGYDPLSTPEGLNRELKRKKAADKREELKGAKRVREAYFEDHDRRPRLGKDGLPFEDRHLRRKYMKYIDNRAYKRFERDRNEDLTEKVKEKYDHSNKYSLIHKRIHKDNDGLPYYQGSIDMNDFVSDYRVKANLLPMRIMKVKTKDKFNRTVHKFKKFPFSNKMRISKSQPDELLPSYLSELQSEITGDDGIHHTKPGQLKKNKKNIENLKSLNLDGIKLLEQIEKTHGKKVYHTKNRDMIYDGWSFIDIKTDKVVNLSESIEDFILYLGDQQKKLLDGKITKEYYHNIIEKKRKELENYSDEELQTEGRLDIKKQYPIIVDYKDRYQKIHRYTKKSLNSDWTGQKQESEIYDLENMIMQRDPHLRYVHGKEAAFYELEDARPDDYLEQETTKIMYNNQLYVLDDESWDIDNDNRIWRTFPGNEYDEQVSNKIKKMIENGDMSLGYLNGGMMYRKAESLNKKLNRIKKNAKKSDTTLVEFVKQSTDARDLKGYQWDRKASYVSGSNTKENAFLYRMKRQEAFAYSRYYGKMFEHPYAILNDRYTCIDLDFDILNRKYKKQVLIDILDLFARYSKDHIVRYSFSISGGLHIFYKTPDKTIFRNKAKVGKIKIDGIDKAIDFDVRTRTTGLPGFTVASYGNAIDDETYRKLYTYSRDKESIKEDDAYVPSGFKERAFIDDDRVIESDKVIPKNHQLNSVHHSMMRSDVVRNHQKFMNPRFIEGKDTFTIPEGFRDEIITDICIIFYNRTKFSEEEVLDWFEKCYRDDPDADHHITTDDVKAKIAHVFKAGYHERRNHGTINDLNEFFGYDITEHDNHNTRYQKRYDYKSMSKSQYDALNEILENSSEDDLKDTELEGYVAPNHGLARANDGMHVLANEFMNQVIKRLVDKSEKNQSLSLKTTALHEFYLSSIKKNQEYHKHFAKFSNSNNFAFNSALQQTLKLAEEYDTVLDQLSLAYYKLSEQGHLKNVRVWDYTTKAYITTDKYYLLSRQEQLSKMALDIVKVHLKDVMKKKSLTNGDYSKIKDRGAEIAQSRQLNDDTLVLLPVEDFFVMMSLTMYAKRGKNGGLFFNLSEDSKFWQAMSIIFRELFYHKIKNPELPGYKQISYNYKLYWSITNLSRQNDKFSLTAYERGLTKSKMNLRVELDYKSNHFLFAHMNHIFNRKTKSELEREKNNSLHVHRQKNHAIKIVNHVHEHSNRMPIIYYEVITNKENLTIYSLDREVNHHLKCCNSVG